MESRGLVIDMDSKEFKAGHRYAVRMFHKAVRDGEPPDGVDLLSMVPTDNMNWYKGCEFGLKDAKREYNMHKLRMEDPAAYYNKRAESSRYYTKAVNGGISDPEEEKPARAPSTAAVMPKKVLWEVESRRNNWLDR